MGTKEKPGKFDCYARAEPDEPIFILLARDPAAPPTIRAWIAERRQLMVKGKKPSSDAAMLIEAARCAEEMNEWRKENRSPERMMGYVFSELVCSALKASKMFSKLVDGRIYREGREPGDAYPYVIVGEMLPSRMGEVGVLVHTYSLGDGRLRESHMLAGAVLDVLGDAVWHHDSFTIKDGRYRVNDILRQGSIYHGFTLVTAKIERKPAA